MRIIIASLLLVFAVAARAEPYAFAGFGSVNDTNIAGVNDLTLPVWLGAGFRKDRFAVEASYLDLSTMEHDYVVQEQVRSSIVNEFERTWRGDALGVAGVYHIGRGFLARVGLYRVSGTIRVRDREKGVDQTTNEVLWAPSIGFGYQDKFTERVSGRATMEYINGRSGADGFRGAMVGGFSLIYSF